MIGKEEEFLAQIENEPADGQVGWQDYLDSIEERRGTPANLGTRICLDVPLCDESTQFWYFI